MISTLANAGLFHPQRARIQSAVDQRFYCQKYDSQLAMDRFNE